MLQRILYGIIGIIISYLIVRFRLKILELTGELEFCKKWLGGTLNAIILIGIFVFFLSILYMTNNMDVLVPGGVLKLF